MLFVHIDSLDMSLTSPQRLRIPEHNTAIFECNYRDAYWRHFALYMISDSYLSFTRTLRISNVTMMNSGYYCCVLPESTIYLEACSVLVIISETI